jgi:hypothetical protein
MASRTASKLRSRRSLGEAMARDGAPLVASVLFLLVAPSIGQGPCIASNLSGVAELQVRGDVCQ